MPVATTVRFDMIAADYHTVCGVASGVAYCWGDNEAGQLGIGTAGGWETTPRQVVTPAGVMWQSIRPSKTCGFTTAGAVYCWGSSNFGLGDGGTISSAVPLLVRGH